MPQINSSYDEVKVPFTKMTFSPDVPPSALGPNEYNIGRNVETDVRGIRSVSGDQEILDGIPGVPTYITGGYRNGGEFWFIAATDDGKWWASNGVDPYKDITPGFVPFAGYTQATNITDSWNGTVPVFNDGINPPFFFPDEPNDSLGNPPLLVVYNNLTQPSGIADIVYDSPTTQRVDFGTPYDEAPYIAGQKVIISGVNNYFNGTFTVVGSTTTYVVIVAQPGAAYPGGGVGQVAPAYTWNYNPNWKSVTAGFIRLYSTPNVGNILVAGNLTVRPLKTITGDTTSGSAVVNTTAATDDMVGATIDGPGIPAGSTILSVVAGVSVTMDNNATATATGINIRLGMTEVNYPVTVQWSQAFALNAMPATWEPTILNVANQLEVPLRGAALDAFPCNGQMFVCSYWDTVVLSPMNYSTTSAPILGVRLFNQGRGLLTANCWGNTDKLVYGFDARDIWVFDGQNFQGLGNQRVKNFFFSQMDPTYFDRAYMQINTQKSQVEIYYSTTEAVAGVPDKMLSYRFDLDCWNPPRDVHSATFACESPLWHYNSDTANWEFNPASRTIVYAQGLLNQPAVQKDIGYEFVEGNSIYSLFRRDNITLLKDYSGKLMVHRLLPELYNLDASTDLIIDPETQSGLISYAGFTVLGANSVGQAPVTQAYHLVTSDTDSPWAQIDQNAYRVNSLKIEHITKTNIWMCTATTWQYTQVEDDR